MIGRTTIPWRAAVWTVCVAALGLYSAGLADAQENKMPVYMGVMQSGPGDTQVKFVFSDISKRGRFVPLQAFSIRPKGGNCNAGPTGDLTLPEEYTVAPVYDSAADGEKVPVSELPKYLANLAGAEMIRKGYAASEEEALPVAICTREVWTAIVGAE